MMFSCNGDDVGQVNPCTLEPNRGPCEAYIPKYYFDSDAGVCKEFIWGGCGGVVPFDTLEECQVCLNQ